MKAYKILVFLCIISVSGSFMNAQDSVLYKVKLEKFKTWQHNGKIAMIVGAPAVAIGVGMIVIGTQTSNENLGSVFTPVGSVLTAVGVIALIPGIIFHGIGKSKTREYQIKLDNLKTGFYYTPNHSGFTLTYRF